MIAAEPDALDRHADPRGDAVHEDAKPVGPHARIAAELVDLVRGGLDEQRYVVGVRLAQRRLDDERMRRAQRIDTDRRAALVPRDDVDERLHADGLRAASEPPWPVATAGIVRLQREQQRGEQRERDTREARRTGHHAEQRHRDDGGQQRRTGIDERRNDDRLAIAEREHERQCADRVQDLDRGSEPRPVEPVVDRLREVRHRDRQRHEHEPAQRHVEENARGIHRRVGELDEVRLQAPGDEYQQREEEPDAVTGRLAVGTIVEQRQREQREDDAEHAELAGALLEQRVRQRDRERR